MFKWIPYPFLRLTPVLIVGILAGNHFEWSPTIHLLLVFSLVYSALAFAIPKRHQYRLRNLIGIVGIFWLFFTSWFYVQYRYDTQQTFHISNTTLPYTHYVATVITPSEARTNSFQAILELDYLVQGDSSETLHTLAIKGKVVVYQPKADSLSTLRYGEQILIQGRPQRVKPPTNPHEFDYQQYLAYQHIYHQHYLPKTQWIYTGSERQNSLLSIAYAMRKHCHDIFERVIQDRQAQGIAQALVLGIKSGLDEDIRNAYAAAGAMHVLAVSGLHVGIIYLVLSFLLKPLTHAGSWGYALRAIICLVFLWAYALLTGLSPSVMRAALMFSFIIVAEATRRQTNIYNTIAASAFFLLLYDPLLIKSVGFQLSYLAVLGIVYLQPKIYHWINPENKWLDWLWGLTSVSIAAQLATFPFGLYYFQQFPVYFWLSNIIVIPAAYMILSLGLTCFVVNMIFPSIIVYPAWLLEKMIQVTNWGVKMIEILPMSVLQGIYFSGVETLLLYGGIVFLLLLCYYRSFKYVWMMSLCLLCMLGWRAVHIYDELQKTSITFYNVPKESRMDLSSGRVTEHWGDKHAKAMYHIASNHVYKGGKTKFLPALEGSEQIVVKPWKNILLMVWKGKKIVMLKEPFEVQTHLTEKLQVDLIIVCNNALSTLSQLSQYFKYQTLIIDSSNTYYQAMKLAEEAEKQKITYHCVPLQGAYEYQIY